MGIASKRIKEIIMSLVLSILQKQIQAGQTKMNAKALQGNTYSYSRQALSDDTTSTQESNTNADIDLTIGYNEKYLRTLTNSELNLMNKNTPPKNLAESNQYYKEKNRRLGFYDQTFVGTLSYYLADIGVSYSVANAIMSKEAKAYKEKGYGAASGWETAGAAEIASYLTSDLMYNILNNAGLPFTNRDEGLDFYHILRNHFILGFPLFSKNSYHGYKRHNNDFWWGLGWGLFGNTGLAIAQGIAKPLPPTKEEYVSINKLKQN